MNNLNKAGPYYGITTMRNGELVGAKGRTPRYRVKRFITQNPGSSVEVLSKALSITPNTTTSTLERLMRDGEIYSENNLWFAGERRKAPVGLINSIWNFADRFSAAA